MSEKERAGVELWVAKITDDGCCDGKQKGEDLQRDEQRRTSQKTYRKVLILLRVTTTVRTELNTRNTVWRDAQWRHCNTYWLTALL
jgi:hypothetical protein